MKQQNKTDICKDCKHPRNWHQDYDIKDGRCYVQLNEEKDVDKMVFCSCKKFIPQDKTEKDEKKTLSKVKAKKYVVFYEDKTFVEKDFDFEDFLKRVMERIDELEPHIVTTDLEDEGQDYYLVDKQEIKEIIKEEAGDDFFK